MASRNDIIIIITSLYWLQHRYIVQKNGYGSEYEHKIVKQYLFYVRAKMYLHLKTTI